MTSESSDTARVESWLADRDADAASLIGRALDSGSPAGMLLRGLENHACRLGSAGEWRPLAAMDAVRDLLPIVGSGTRELLPAAATYLRRHEPRTLHPEWCERAPLSESPVVYAGSLDEALEARDLEGAGAAVARLLSVVQTQEYFHELLLEAASRDWNAPGWTLIGASVVVRALIDRPWSEGREYVFRLLESLRHARIGRLGAIPAGESVALPIAGAYLVAAREAKDFSAACLYLCHAFQAERFCPLRRRQVRYSIGQSLKAWFPGLGKLPPDWQPSPLPPVPEGAVEEAGGASAEGSLLVERIRRGETEEAIGRALAWSRAQPDPDPLFGWLALATAESLAAGDPRPLLLVNGARWGAHLLRGDREGLVARVVREVSRKG